MRLRTFVWILWIGWNFCCCSGAWAQEIQTLHYSLQNHLGSNECYAVQEDSQGNIWISSDAGVTRFDGREFETFDETNGLTDNVVFSVYEDLKGKIWFMTMNSELCYYTEGKIEIYPFNDLVKQVITRGQINDLLMDEAGTLTLNWGQGGIFQISAKGQVKRGPLLSGQAYLVQERGQTFSGRFTGAPPLVFNKVFVFNSLDSYFKSSPEKVYSSNFQSQFTGKPDAESMGEDVFLTWGNVLYKFHAGEMFRLEFPIGIIFLKQYGGEFYLGTYRDGYYKVDPKEFKIIDHWYEGNSVSWVHIDKHAQNWVSTLENGVFCAKRPNIQNLTLNSLQSSLNAMAVSDSKVVVGDEIGQVYELDKKGTLIKEEVLAGEHGKSPVSSIEIEGDITYIGGRHLWTLKDDISRMIGKKYMKLLNSTNEVFSFYHNDALHILNLQTMVKEYFPKVNRGRIKKVQKVTEPAGSYVYLSGKKLGIFSQTEEIVIDSTHKVVAFLLDEQGTMYYLTYGGEVYVYDGEQAQLYQQLPGNRYRDFLLHQGTFYFLRSDALFVIEAAGWNCLDRISVEDGLTGKDYLEVRENQDTLWLLSKTKISRVAMADFHTDQSLPEPGFSLEINRKETPITRSKRLRPGLNDWTFRIFNKRQDNVGIVYYYQLLPHDATWQKLNGSEVKYTNLVPDDYEFKLKATYNEVNFSPEVSYHLALLPPLYKRLWFILLILGAIGGSVAVGVVTRVKRLKKEAQVDNEILRLRAQVFQAQVKPHFTFNVLNGIQKLVVTNDTYQANLYLAEFASLLRSSLNLSQESLCSIEKELKFLERYIKLENLRFDDILEFKVSNPEKLDLEKLQLPPLLLQPIVENSINHGILQNDAGTAGQIEMLLMPHADGFSIQILDNGVGYGNSYKEKSTDSLGLKITQKRLQLLNEKNSLTIGKIQHPLFSTQVTLTFHT